MKNPGTGSEASVGLSLRAAERGDRKLLWEWANDPEVRAVSFHSDPIPWEDHVRWFDRKLADADCVLYIACDDLGHPIGQVRFDLDESKAKVSISLDRGSRGRGLGAQVLRAACREFFSLRRRTTVDAWIKPDNDASLSAFRKVGFGIHGRETVNGCAAMHLVLEERDLSQ